MHFFIILGIKDMTFSFLHLYPKCFGVSHCSIKTWSHRKQFESKPIFYGCFIQPNGWFDFLSIGTRIAIISYVSEIQDLHSNAIFTITAISYLESMFRKKLQRWTCVKLVVYRNKMLSGRSVFINYDFLYHIQFGETLKW